MMKKIITYSVAVFSMLLLLSCRTVFRNYNDEELSELAISDYGFSEFKVFKIIDLDTSYYLTGSSYQNSGVIIGVKNGQDVMLFIPRRISEEPVFVNESLTFNLDSMYQELKGLEDDMGNKLYNDPANDYGGFSLSVLPYVDIKNVNPELLFDSELIFTFTTDETIFYIGYVRGEIVVFNNNYLIIN